jgi:hypothetical protein
MRYQVWSEDGHGLKIFPFASNRTRSLEQDIENYVSTPYNGDPKALVRGSVEGDYELSYLLCENRLNIKPLRRFSNSIDLLKSSCSGIIVLPL